MKALVKWFAKKLLNNEKIKEAIHAANAKLAQSVTIDSAKTQKVIDAVDEGGKIGALYIGAFANDGKMDDAEVADINAAEDALVDKYLTDDAIEAVIDSLFA